MNSRKILTQLKAFIFKNKFILLSLCTLFVLHWVNTFHTVFPDEFDNIVGGWYINQGKLPYIGFFSHHNPGAYFIASLITFFTGQSFVAFRKLWAVVLFIIFVTGYAVLRKRVNTTDTTFYVVFMVLWAITATYFWGHMLLSETVVGYAFLPVYGLVFLKALTNKLLTLLDIALVSIVVSIALLTSLTFVFALGIFIGFTVYLYAKQWGISRKLFYALGIILAPYFIFGIYLLATGGVSEYKSQAIDYNRDYYIYNFPVVAGQISKHPVRYAVSIFYHTNMQFHSLLAQLDHFSFSYPVNITLALGNLVLLLYLLSKRKYMLAGAIYLIVIYLNARSEPLSSKETDFHSTVYAMVSIFHIVYVLKMLFTDINVQVRNIRFIYQGLFALLGIYSFFTTLFLVRSFSEKAYTKFMGQAPAIYDAPVAAPIINKLVSKNDFFWIGPFEFQELLYIQGKLPSKYHWFLPANERSEKIRTEIVTDLLENKPKLIVFKDDLGYFGVNPEVFNYPIVNILNAYYFRIPDLAKDGTEYTVLIQNLHNFDIARNFYFDVERKDEIVKQLVDSGIIKLANE